MPFSPRLGGDLLAWFPGGLDAHVPGAVLQGRGLGGGGGPTSAVPWGRSEGGNVSSCFQFLLSNLIFTFVGSSGFTMLGGDLLPGCPGGCDAPVLGTVLLRPGGGGDGGGVAFPAGEEVEDGGLSSFLSSIVLLVS